MKCYTCLFLILAATNVFADWKLETLDGVQVHYYVPKAESLLMGKSTKRALMVNLHGCSQKAEDLKKDGNWDNTADEFNMVVALPKVPNGGVIAGCWDYYGGDHNLTNRHNGDIVKLVKALLAKTDLMIDPGQVYLSGLSSGGGESMIMGCLAPDLFAGIGVNAGPSPGTSSSEISRPQTTYNKILETCKKLGKDKTKFFKTQLTSIIYGNNDFIVNTAHDINNAEIMRTIYGADNKSTFDTKKLEGTNTVGIGIMWSDGKGPRVSLIMNTNLGHNWPAGQGGNDGSFINKKSINYPNYLAKFFFTNNRRSKLVALPEVMVDPIQTKESRFIVSGLATIPIELIKNIDVEVRKKETGERVDTFNATLGRDNRFTGFSKELPDGEYNFDVEVKNSFGLRRTFKRNSWLGEVAGINTPQLVNTSFQSVSGCFVAQGQVYDNGGDKVTVIKVFIDQNKSLEAAVENTKWSFSTCDLSSGEHAAVIFAENNSGHLSNVEQINFTTSPSLATSTLQEHMEAKRLRWGDYGIWYLKYGNHRFTLYLGDNQIWHD